MDTTLNDISNLLTTYDPKNDVIYEELLYEVCHPVGQSDQVVGEESMITYLQNAFKIPYQTHVNLLKAAKARSPPKIKLNVNVIEAKNLTPSDSNGKADPFVTLNLASDPSPPGSHETDVKMVTLEPKWNEKFTFQIEKPVAKEVLKIQVWDFDPAETTGEKLSKIKDVKGLKGLGRFFKEVVGPSGKEVNELIASVDIPLNTVPTTGTVRWFKLQNPENADAKDEIHIGLAFGSFRDQKEVLMEHRKLVKQFLLEQMMVTKAAQFECTGKFCAQAANYLIQHATHGGLTDTETAMVRWSVFFEVHKMYALSFGAFNELLNILTTPIQKRDGITKENLSMFEETLVELLASAIGWLRQFQRCGTSNKSDLETLMYALKFIDKVEKLGLQVDLFPKHLYGWLNDSEELTAWKMDEVLKVAIQSSAKAWFANLVTGQSNCDDSQVDQIEDLTSFTETVRTELEKAVQDVDLIFKKIKHFNYAKYLFQVYDKELTEVVLPLVTDYCDNLKPIDTTLSEECEVDKQVEKSIFKLYMELRQLSDHGSKILGSDGDFKLKNCHRWFSKVVQHWLDVSIYKAKLRVEKAIEMDTLLPLDDHNRNSTSAVDSVGIFYQVYNFWKNLEWPEPETEFAFVQKIIDEICFCCDFYAEKMSNRADKIKKVDEGDGTQKFVVTKEWCCAVNNLDFVRDNLEKMVQDFNLDSIVDHMPENSRHTLLESVNSVVKTALDREQDHIFKFIDEIAARMAPNLKSFLSYGAEHLQNDGTALDKIMSYLEDSLTTLNNELNTGNFELVMDKMWLEICRVLDLKTKMSSVETQPMVYANLLTCINLLLENFQCKHENSDDCICKDALDKIMKRLQLFGYSTEDLIHQYYVDRYEAQKLGKLPTTYGSITVKCSFSDNTLKVEVMNAKELRSLHPDGSLNVLAEIHLLPSHKFKDVKVLKTKPVKDSLFPIFDEELDITLSEELMKVENAILLIRVKDSRLFGFRNYFMADSLVSFDQIVDNQGQSQIELPLWRPVLHDFACIEALASRNTDKKAKKMLKALQTEQHTTNNLPIVKSCCVIM